MSISKWFTITLLIVLLARFVAQAQNPPSQASGGQTASPAVEDVQIIIQSQQVRIAARSSIIEMQLQVFDKEGALVYDSGLLSGSELSWALRNASGEAIPSGLYAYTLTVKETNAETPALRRGHLIVERGRDRDPQTDRLWVTSQGAVGAETAISGGEMTVSTGPETNVVGARIGRTFGERGGMERDAQGRLIAEQGDKLAGKKEGLQFAPNISGAGTTNQITKWTDGPNGVVGDSILTEVGGKVGIGTKNLQTDYRLEVRGNSDGVISYRWYNGVVGHGDDFFGTGVTGRGSYGVFGHGIFRGVWGYSPWIGVYGDSPNGYAGYFKGRLRVETSDWGKTVASFGGYGDFQIDSNGIVGGRFIVKEDGSVGIGTATPADRLHVAGGFLRLPSLVNGGLYPLCHNHLGQVSYCSSSLRYKTDLAPFRGGLNLVNRLQPITFNWKNNGEADLGLGAEDVAEVEPLLVTHNDKGEIEGVKYDRIAVVLLNAIKEQQQEITQLKRELRQLQTSARRHWCRGRR